MPLSVRSRLAHAHFGHQLKENALFPWLVPSSRNTMVLFELVLIADARVEGHKMLELLKRISKLVVSRSGVVRKVDNWGLRPLAQRIRKNQEDHLDARYLSLWMDAHPSLLQEINQIMKYDRTILQHKTFHRSALEEAKKGFLASEVHRALEGATTASGRGRAAESSPPTS